jgi:hypothetical protein
MLLITIAVLGLTLLVTGCITSLFSGSAGFDQKIVTIQTLSLFDQRKISRLSRRSWKGDWIMRRDRLELVDDGLRNLKPDVLMFQELTEKVGNTAESDQNILSAGALVDYIWEKHEVTRYPDTQEIESLATAIGPPHKPIEGEASERDMWILGTGGYLMASTINIEDQPVLAFNVKMPVQTDNEYIWYSFIQERIAERLAASRHCYKRVVVAGLLPGDEGAMRYAEFMRNLQMKDVSAGFCQISSKCYTATPTNDIYMASVGDESPSRVDKIFLHQSALIYTSSRNFTDSDPNNRYSRDFGLTRLFASQRFGWVAQARFARCTEREINEYYKKKN